MALFDRFDKDGRAAAGLEYGLAIGLIAIVAMLAITSSGSSVKSLFGGVSGAMADGLGQDSVPPVVASGQSLTVAEGSGDGEAVGTVQASDNRGIAGFAILSGNEDGVFAISDSGQLTTTSAAAGLLDHTVTPSYSLVVEATDQGGLTSGPVTVTVTVLPAGTAFAWGANGASSLGTASSVTPLTVPTSLNSTETFVDVAAGNDAACTLTDTGIAHCWGHNFTGVLGDGTTTHRMVPGPVNGGHSFTKIHSNGNSFCAIAQGGDGYCWGWNDEGQLGVGDQTIRTEPTAVQGGLSFIDIAVAENHGCGVTTSNDAYCWGWEIYGQLGNGGNNNSNRHPSPVAVQGGHSFETVEVGSAASCGLRTDGLVYCWGDHPFIGISSSVPVPLSGGHVFDSMVSGGGLSFCGLRSDGSTWCWGNNNRGQLGDGTRTTRTSPVEVLGGHNFVRLGLGRNHSCGVKANGEGWCWGRSGHGILGNGVTVDDQSGDALSPVQVQSPIPFSYITGSRGSSTFGILQQ